MPWFYLHHQQHIVAVFGKVKVGTRGERETQLVDGVAVFINACCDVNVAKLDSKLVVPQHDDLLIIGDVFDQVPDLTSGHWFEQHCRLLGVGGLTPICGRWLCCVNRFGEYLRDYLGSSQVVAKDLKPQSDGDSDVPSICLFDA